MSAWTVRQEEILREYGHLGVDAVADQLLKECGVERSKGAIAVHAHRIHVSLRTMPECPECHAIGVHLNRLSGLCPACTLRAKVEEERAFNELLAAEAEGCEGGAEMDELKRRYDRLRQRNSRLARRHGLRGKRERE